MKNILSFYLFFFTIITTFSQSFTGKIIDKETQKAIPNAQVYFIDLKTGTLSDTNGIFKITSTHQNSIHLQISFLGYDNLDTLVNINTNKTAYFYLHRGHFNLDEVVVSAPKGKLQGENIVSIEHKKLKTLQQTAPLTLAESLTNISGVSQVTTGSGIGKPVIRGLSGNRIVMYSQGVRIENQQWGDEHGLGVGEVGIESIEVIKGPASLLYGSDALGGVLYFIDERYANENTIESFVQSKYLTNTTGFINTAGVKLNKGKIKFNVFGTHSSHADYQIPNYKRVYNTRFDEKNIKGSVGFNTDNWISNIRYSYLVNDFGIVEDSVFTSPEQNNKKFPLPYQTINNHNLSFENTIYTGDSKLKLILGYANNYRKEFEDNNQTPALGLKLKTFTHNLK